ncbi:MOSC domain-containing protein [Brevibacillus choshinensis]|uniref:MOSC domain-containing protein n=1 Tax=Brevibacillus choshinensis TaxID=54911 RepID=A0ABX7FTW1_BRECH|nr:MOSC domain-containing protein [Brevibacillus choshinensis]QRG68410.1 MOSC domain-containing protein [Brevibacillus choshinensis]
MKQVGRLQSIFRHPVKAMRGEQLTHCQVDAFGLYGDRGYYFLDESRNGKYLSADVVPALLGYAATFTEQSADEQYPEIRVVAKDGSVHTWGDSLFDHVAQTAKRPILPKRSTPLEGGKNWEDHILLVTDASLREIARLIGEEQLDPRRFRGNLVVVLEEDEPFAEDRWMGKQIRIGDVVLQVNRHCERCMYVNIDPDTLEMNPAVLKACVKRHDNHFGVYASVITPGEVAEGDAVFVSE